MQRFDLQIDISGKRKTTRAGPRVESAIVFLDRVWSQSLGLALAY